MAILLKIQIRGIKKPPVWRRLIIPDTFTFAQLHQTIQTAFGWWDEHLYMFQKKPYDRGWCINSSEQEDDYRDDDALDAEEINIKEFISNYQLEKFVYVYDFGDDWIHDITVENTMYLSSCAYPVCVDGKGACPSEDCGGIWGYEEQKAGMSKEEYSYFDKEETNEALKEEFSSDIDNIEEESDDDFDEPLDNEDDIPDATPLLELVNELEINELSIYAEFLSLDMGKLKSYTKICEQYVKQILDKPKSILRMLPFEDFCILKKLHEEKRPKNLVTTYENTIDCVLVKYGFAEEWRTRNGLELQIASDFFTAVEPYIEELHDDIEYHNKVSIESIVTGMANIYGLVSRSFVLQEMVRHEVSSSVEEADSQLDLITLQSLQMHELYCESEKYAEHPNNDNCYYHSRHDDYWPIKLAEERESYSHEVSDYAKYELKDILIAATNLPIAPNSRQEEFCSFLVNELKVEPMDVPWIVHNLWSMEMNKGKGDPTSLSIQLYFEEDVLIPHACTDKQREKAWEELDDYLNNMPHWVLCGHIPQETGLLLSEYSKDKGKSSFLERSPYSLADWFTPTNPYISERTPRPNDPCPCGSGKKYKQCCGKN